MSRASQSLGAAAVVCILVVSGAFVVAPRACDGGFEIYVKGGLLALVVLATLPFVLRIGSSLALRAASGLGLVVLGIGAWIVGLFAANVNFLCRLF